MTALALLFLASLAVAYAGPRVLVPAVDALDAHPLIAPKRRVVWRAALLALVVTLAHVMAVILGVVLVFSFIQER